MSVRFDAVEHKVNQNETLFQSLQTSMNSFFSRLSILVAAGGLIATGGAIQQSNRIDEQIANATKKVDEAIAKTKPQEIYATSVLNPLDDTDIIYAEPALSYQLFDGKVPQYSLILYFRFRVSFSGTGANHIGAYQVKFDNNFVGNFFQSRRNVYGDSLMTGLTLTTDNSAIVPDVYYTYSFSVDTKDKRCETIEKETSDLFALPELGSVEITPIFDVAPLKSATRKFRIKARDSYRSFDCSDVAAALKAATPP